MAEWHLDELENEIQRIGWRIKSRLDGDDYKISASWIIERGTTRQIDFEGLDEMKCLPIEKAYGCKVNDTEIKLYFYKKGDNWNSQLAGFISELNKLF
jgi:hypothetical protein